MTNETMNLLKDSVYYAEKAHECLGHESSEQSIHSGLYFISSVIRDLAKAYIEAGKETE